MAEKKMTRKEALTIAIEVVENEEAREVLQKMYDQVTKPRIRKPNTEKRDANIALGEQFAANFEGETFKAADVAEVLEVSKPKANAICKAMGWDEVPTTEKVKVYTLG